MRQKIRIRVGWLLAGALLTLVHVTVAADTASQLPKSYVETITTSDSRTISFEMVFIPGGSFLMGSPPSEAGRQDHEGPPYPVKLDAFYLCTTEATLDLFLWYYQETVCENKDALAREKTKAGGMDGVNAITGATPVYGDMTMGYGEKHPAIGMSWQNAMFFCEWLAKKTGRKYRLPTEAEWEYACRADTSTAFSFGNDPNQLGDFTWYKGNAKSEPHEVARKKPNAWGLYDMLGNVHEWVYDFYSPAAYQEAAKKNPAINPKGPASGTVHVARGGDYTSTAEALRCAARNFEEMWWHSDDPQIPKSKWWLPNMDFIGFRVARSIEKENK